MLGHVWFAFQIFWRVSLNKTHDHHHFQQYLLPTLKQDLLWCQRPATAYGPWPGALAGLLRGTWSTDLVKAAVKDVEAAVAPPPRPPPPSLPPPPPAMPPPPRPGWSNSVCTCFSGGPWISFVFFKVSWINGVKLMVFEIAYPGFPGTLFVCLLSFQDQCFDFFLALSGFPGLYIYIWFLSCLLDHWCLLNCFSEVPWIFLCFLRVSWINYVDHCWLGVFSRYLSKNMGTIGGKAEGVCFLTHVPGRPLHHDWPIDVWHTAKLQVAAFQVGLRWIQGGICYGYAKNACTKEVQDWTNGLLQHLTVLLWMCTCRCVRILVSFTAWCIFFIYRMEKRRKTPTPRFRCSWAITV